MEKADYQSGISYMTHIPKSKYILYENYPNPFNLSTTIQYQLYEQMSVKIAIYDILGRLVTTLTDGLQPSGNYQVVWNGRNRDGQEVASGVYLYLFQTKGMKETKKILLLR
jgi:flagellar hook assembly protein FlgD